MEGLEGIFLLFKCSVRRLQLQTQYALFPSLSVCVYAMTVGRTSAVSVPPSFHNRMQAWHELSLPSAKAWLLLLQTVCCQSLNVIDLGIMMNRIIDPAIHRSQQ